MSYVSVEVKTPTMLITDKKVRADIRLTMREEMRKARGLFRRTHSNWGQGPAVTQSGFVRKLANEPIDWHIVTRSGPAEIFGVLYTESEKYKFVNYGTDRKGVIFSSDWSSKTRPRVLRSGPGSGEVVKATLPYGPGIEGRFFDERIIELRQPRFTAAFSRLVADWSKMMFNK